MMRLFMPRKITTQLVVLISLSVVIFHLCFTLGFVINRSISTGSDPDPMGFRTMADIAQALELMPKDKRPEYVRQLQDRHPRIIYEAEPVDRSWPAVAQAAGPALEKLHQLLGDDVQIHPTEDRIEIRLHDSSILTLPLREMAPPPNISHIILSTLLFIMVSMTLFLIWAIRNVTRPLNEFVQAVDQFALDQKSAILPETWPDEINVAARAFNRMQARIQGLMEDRTRMLASIGHDLRTPITRLRLRSEFVEDPKIRNAIVHDLAHMDEMVHSALSYLRDASVGRPMSKIDLATLVQTICDDYDDMGHEVVFEGADHLIVEGRLDALRRAITNVVNNAVAFGDKVLVSLRTCDEGHVEIAVCDDGPGIKETEKEALFEPFKQGEKASSGATGFGLGLSIVRAVMEDHGGSVILSNQPSGGLKCSMKLPIVATVPDLLQPGRA